MKDIDIGHETPGQRSLRKLIESPRLLNHVAENAYYDAQDCHWAKLPDDRQWANLPEAEREAWRDHAIAETRAWIDLDDDERERRNAESLRRTIAKNDAMFRRPPPSPDSPAVQDGAA